jgi:hypothetical protein
MITEKETQFLEEVIREHPKAIEKLIGSYNMRLPITAQTLFSLYVKKGKYFSDQLDEIDAEEPEVSGLLGKAITNALPSDVLGTAYNKLKGMPPPKHKGTAKHKSAQAEKDTETTDATEVVEKPKKTTYNIFGKEISKMLVWSVSAVAGLFITWGIVALLSNDKD